MIEEEDLVDSMRALDIAHFAEVSTPFIDAQYCIIRYPPPTLA